MRALLGTFLFVVVFVAPIAAQDAPVSVTELHAKIEELKVPDVAWREIPWKSCLLEGLRKSQRTKRPGVNGDLRHASEPAGGCVARV